MYGATAAAILSALVIGLVSMYAKEREDTVISSVWAIGMAVGVLFLYKIPGNWAADAMSYLFGNILLVSKIDLWLVLGMDVLVAAVGLGFYNKFLALCFDEEFAELRGVRTKVFYLILLVPHGPDRGALGPCGGHGAGDRAYDPAAGRGRLFFPAILADDALGRNFLGGCNRRGHRR